jgi:2-iminobutanoate/2-iminopropanoate deaminase
MPEGIGRQTFQTLKNLEAVLVAAGSGLDKVLRTTVYIKNMEDFQDMNGVYAEFFRSEAPPARSTVEVSRLPKGALVEIDAIAFK